MPGKIFRQFFLPNTRESMVESLREIRGFISEFLPANVVERDIIFKVEMVVTELLTNALKHVKDSESHMRIYIDNQWLSIEKTDFGTQFNPNNFADIFNHPVGYKILHSFDELHSVYAVLENDNRVRFTCKPKIHRQEIDPTSVDEHFGMIIISKSAEEFTYNYDSDSGLNRFNVRIKLA